MPFAVLNGARLWYDDWPGKHGGPPLFFQHGYHGYRLGHEPGGLASLLHERAGHRCIFIEARGCEESRGAPGPHGIEQYAEDCLALLDLLKVRRTYFVGHSMGGAVGYWLGVHYPSRLVGLVLLTPAPSGRGKGSRPAAPAPPPRVTLTASYALAQPTEEDEEVELARARAESYPELTPKSSSEEFIRQRIIRRRTCDPGHYHGAMQSMMQLQLLDRLPEMEVDTLMICGGLDPLLPSNLRDFGQLPKASLCVLPFASHQVQEDEPERCCREIEAFLKSGAQSFRTIAERVVAYYQQRGAKL